MRFRYFDAGGNEVSLATAAALAIKIDLGEVTETTLLYDAACDEWAPAGEQEIYRHIVEHGAPEPPGDTPDSSPVADEAPSAASSGEPDAAPGNVPEAAVDAVEHVEDVEKVDDVETVDAVEEVEEVEAVEDEGPPAPPPGARPVRPTAPPLADFWGPALSTSQGEKGPEDPMEAFDLSLDSLTSSGETSDTPGASAEVLEDLPRDLAPEAPDDLPQRGSAARPDETAPDDEAVGAKPETPADPPAASGPEKNPEGAASFPPSRQKGRRAGRSRDPSLAKLEAIAREATERMEREEALRKGRRAGKSGPSLGDRVAENARKGGRKTGEALKSGAAVSARALSEGGKATAETVGAGMRALRKGVRGARPRVRRILAGLARLAGGGASGLLGGTLAMLGRIGSAASWMARGVGAGASGAVRGLGGVLRFTGRVARAVVLAPVRGAALTWRMLAPIGGRAGKEAGKALGAGMRGLRRAMFSPLTLGVVIFTSAFLVFTYGGGREAGEELWQATVGIARSAAAETDEAAETDAAPEADALEASGGPGGEGASRAAAPGTGETDLLAREERDSAENGGVERLPEDDPAVVAASLEVALLEEFAGELAQASEGALQDMIAAMDSLERAFQLPAAPPEEWLGGYYLSHATEFHDVRLYWARYRGYIRSVKAEDAVLYRRGLEARFRELGVPRERLPELMTVAERRFREGRARRDSLYDVMADVAEAAVDLHDFLAENEGAIEYDPVRPGRVSRAPVLEAYPSTPEIKAEMDARLDRILERMEQVHTLKPVFTRELQDVLFTNLQAVEAVDTFRLGPRDVAPDSGGVPPGG